MLPETSLAIEISQPRKKRDRKIEVTRSQMKLLDVLGDIRDQRDHGEMNEVWQVAQALIVCGLPYDEIAATQWSKSARLGDGSELRVTFSATQEGVSLPFGQDRGPLFYMINKAILQYKQIEASLPPNLTPIDRQRLLDEARFVRWNTASEYLDFMEQGKDGRQRDRLRARIERLRFCAISVHRVTQNHDESLVAPIMRATRLPKWAQSKSAKKKQDATYSLIPLSENDHQTEGFELGADFFHDFVRYHAPVPSILIKKFLYRPMYLDLFMLMNWRSFAAKSDTLIPFDDLRAQIGTKDSNDGRIAGHLRQIIAIMHGAGWKEFRAEVRMIRNGSLPNGLLIGPPVNGIQLLPPTEKNRKKIKPEKKDSLKFSGFE